MHSPNHSPVQQHECDQPTFAVNLPDQEATVDFGQKLAPLLTPGMVVWLVGDLGCGKTTLVRGLLLAVGHTGPVKSPTYALVEVYVVSSLYWYHFDFYRISEPEEFDDAGLGEYFRNDAVCLVEWPEKAADRVPAADLSIRLRFAAGGPESGRNLEITAHGETGRKCLAALTSRMSPAGI